MSTRGNLSNRVSTYAAGAFTVEEVIYWMTGAPLRTDLAKFSGYGAHEALPAVKTTLDWYGGARPGVGPIYPNSVYSYNDASTSNDGEVYGYHNVWGEVVPYETGSPVGSVPGSVRVQVDAPKVYHLAAGASSWTAKKLTESDAGNFDGGFFRTSPYGKVIDFVSNTHFRKETTGWSIDLSYTLNGTSAQPPTGPSVAHFFWNGFLPRLQIPDGGQVAIWNRMRLISDTGADLTRARFLGHFSGDLFTGATVTVNPSGVNPPFGLPRFLVLTGSWKNVGHVTGTPTEIRSYPKLPFLD